MFSRTNISNLGRSIVVFAVASISVSQADEFVFVANQTSSSVSAYRIGATGALTFIGSVGAGFLPTAVAADPTGKFVYVVNGTCCSAGSVLAYSIGPTGALTPIGLPVPTGLSPTAVAVDPTGRFVFVANRNDNSISSYSIGPTGELTPIGSAVDSAGSFPEFIAVDPTGRFVYVANGGSAVSAGNNIAAFSIGTTGTLTLIGFVGSPVGLAVGMPGFGASGFPQSVAVDPTGKFVYAVSQPLFGPNLISAYSIAATGALSPIGSPLPGGAGFSVAVDRTAKFVYVATGNGILEYSIGAAGALTFVGGVVAGDFSSRPVLAVAVDATGKFLYVAIAGGNSDNISAYSIGPTGALTLIGSAPTGAGPRSLAITSTTCHASPIVRGVSATPAVLWPPNQKMADVTVNYDVMAPCGTAACTLSVTSNEPTNGSGDGKISPDWAVIDQHHVELRADRSANGNGRIYTIAITCTDTVGNSAKSSTTVLVPHDQGHD